MIPAKKGHSYKRFTQDSSLRVMRLHLVTHPHTPADLQMALFLRFPGQHLYAFWARQVWLGCWPSIHVAHPRLALALWLVEHSIFTEFMSSFFPAFGSQNSLSWLGLYFLSAVGVLSLFLALQERKLAVPCLTQGHA